MEEQANEKVKMKEKGERKEMYNKEGNLCKDGKEILGSLPCISISIMYKYV